MIYFYDKLIAKTLETIKEAHDCADILNDLNRISQAIENVKLYGYWSKPTSLIGNCARNIPA